MANRLSWQLFLLVALFLQGCAARDYGWEAQESSRSQREVLSQANAELNAAWAARDNPVQLRRALELYESDLETKPESRFLLVRLARGYYLYGVLLTDTNLKLAAFKRGMHYGDRALYTFPEFRERFDKSRQIGEAVETLGIEAIGAIYWAAVNMAKWARLEGMVKILLLKNKARAMVEHVYKLDSGYNHGAADRYLGAYYAVVPAYAGGDLERSRRHFEQALARAPNYIGNRVYMAETFAVAKSDGHLFRKLLREAIAADPSSCSDAVPEQRLAQARARDLLQQYDDLFWDEDEDERTQLPTK